MSISDELMWRYYELLTDVKVPEIEQMKADVACRQATSDADEESAGAQDRAGLSWGRGGQAAADENWARQFQKDEVPENVETVCSVKELKT